MIYFFIDTPKFKFNNRKLVKSWLNELVIAEGFKMGDLNIIFCTDEYLLKMNIEFLEHDYYTDVITFDYTEEDIVSGEIFISIDTIKNNSISYKVDFVNELFRVIAHGVLHLIGYEDSTENEKIIMREKEDFYLTKIHLL